MNGKITLITPPDIFENETKSILFIHLTPDDQERVSKWLSKTEIEENLNIYFFDNEIDVAWLLHAVSISNSVFIDFNNLNNITTTLGGYILGKKQVCYKTDDETTAATCQYINQNRVTTVELFLERVFNG